MRRIATLAFGICIAAGVACAAVVIAQSKPDARVQSAPASPSPASLPDGPGKAIAEAACLSCHASDILRQQRLTRQQWTGTLTKMVNWGTVIPDGQRDLLLDYLSSNFGPENASFQPATVRPIGK